MITINELIYRSHENAKKKGFWDEDRNTGELIALIHSELSEALEAARHGNPPSDHITNFTGLEEELADAMIRIADMAGGLELDLAEAIEEKLLFNMSRPPMHGKRF